MQSQMVPVLQPDLEDPIAACGDLRLFRYAGSVCAETHIGSRASEVTRADGEVGAALQTHRYAVLIITQSRSP